MATKAYVDAQGGGCYSKCADSGTSAGGATPSCPGGYSSVDTWSERAAYGMSQWQGMNSAAYSSTRWEFCTASGCNAGSPFNYALSTRGHKGCADNDSGQKGVWAVGWNTGYTGGTASANYYNDCTACCAD